MVGTVRAARHRGRRALSGAGAAFAAGLVLAGAVTFGALGALGSLLHPGRAFLVAAAGALVLALAVGEARAATPVASPAGDPSAAGTDLVWQEPGVGGFLLRNGQQTQLPGNDPVLGGSRIAWHAGDEVTIAA